MKISQWKRETIDTRGPKPLLLRSLEWQDGELPCELDVVMERIMLTTLEFFVNNRILRSCPARNF